LRAIEPFALAGAAWELARLTRQQWLEPERLRELQWRRLRAIVRHAAARVPFYRERFAQAGLPSADIRSWDDLAKIPVLGRLELQHPERLIASGYDPGELMRSHTSGSTGIPTTTFFDRRAWTLGKHVLKLRARLACGMRPLDRVAIVGEGAPAERRKLLGRRSASYSVHEDPFATLERMRDFGPTALYGPPGTLLRIVEAGAPPGSIRLVFTSAEMLDGTTRRRLEEAFQAPVLDVYGCTEAKEIAWQCPEHGAYHINAEWLVVEVVDDEGQPAEHEGAIVVTSLYNRGMPLIRYRIGDTGRRLDERCPCGRGLPLMIPVLGRSVDYVRLPDGGAVSPYSLTCAVENVPGMRQYQIVQGPPGDVRVRVVPDYDFGTERENAVRQALEPVLPGVAIHVERVGEIPREPSGKYRIVRSDVGGQDG
jgi:phenylacetate-CoA ligase